jgi:hypothetical protein
MKQFTVAFLGDNREREAVDRIVRQAANDLRSVDVEVEAISPGRRSASSKGDLAIVSELIMQLGTSAGTLAAVTKIVCARLQNPRIGSIKITDGDQSIEISGFSRSESVKVVEEFLKQDRNVRD